MNSFEIGITGEAANVPRLINKLIFDKVLALALSIVAVDLEPLGETPVKKLNAAV